VDDRQREHDAFMNVSWVRVLSQSTLLTLSPFVHQNNAGFEGGPDDPLVASDRRDSRYAGAQATLAGAFGHNEARLGAFGFVQRDNVEFGLRSNDVALSQNNHLHGNLAAVFAEDAFDVASWLTLRGGLRVTRFSGGLAETVMSPRFGATARL